MKKLIFAFLFVACACFRADAYYQSRDSNYDIAVVTYTGPGDVVSGATAWYGLRAYSAATVGNVAVNIRRTSDSRSCDVVTTTTGLGNTSGCSVGGDNGTAVATWCNATTCFATKWYDQTQGNKCTAASCDLVQTTAANQPQLIFSCNGSLPCLRTTTSTQTLVSANNITPATGVVTLSAVFNRTAGTSAIIWISENGGANRNQIRSTSGAANSAQLQNGGSIAGAASDATFNAGNGVINGASSVFNIGGTETTGTITGSTTANTPLMTGTGTSAADWEEIGFWDNVAFTGTQLTNMCHNQRLYWSTAGTC